MVGRPEINIKPWDALQKDLKNGNSRVTWSNREPYAYWKGNEAVAVSRQELVKCNTSSTQDWNARIYTQVICMNLEESTETPSPISCRLTRGLIWHAQAIKFSLLFKEDFIILLAYARREAYSL